MVFFRCSSRIIKKMPSSQKFLRAGHEEEEEDQDEAAHDTETSRLDLALAMLKTARVEMSTTEFVSLNILFNNI